MATRQTRAELIELVTDVVDPQGLPSRTIDKKLLLFAINCPDPVGALNIAIEAEVGTTPAEIVDQALAMPARDINSVPSTEMHASHELRRMQLDSI